VRVALTLRLDNQRPPVTVASAAPAVLLTDRELESKPSGSISGKLNFLEGKPADDD